MGPVDQVILENWSPEPGRCQDWSMNAQDGVRLIGRSVGRDYVLEALAYIQNRTPKVCASAGADVT